MALQAFMAVLDSAPRPNGAPITAAQARMHLRAMERAFTALTATEDWRRMHPDEAGRVIEVMQGARTELKQAVRRERRAARVDPTWADEDA